MHVQSSSPCLNGTVTRALPAQYHVFTGQYNLLCTDNRPRDCSECIVTGDAVRLVETASGAGQIVEVLPRRSQLTRCAVASRQGAYAGEQVLVANIDQVIFVFAAANPEPHWTLLDRYLVAAHAQNLLPLVCITKMDLLENTDAQPALLQAVEEYRRIGYRVLLTSSRGGSGMDALRAAMDGKTSALFGKSGVGKTSLLNALVAGLGERVSAVNPVTGKGRHTTTTAQVFTLPWGALIDTPGMREFALWDVDAHTLDQFFPEMRPFVGRCRFRAGCSHTEEPGCAVRAAVAGGQISPRRFNSYLRLRMEG